jgi:alkanesulfonate monooxygenase SsuD/methylene tetrahydromethanopterin reductase-like flavin-dependent oxidoreductase (luciferase family)
MGQFREACEIIHSMWTEEAATFTGKYYSIDKPINLPQGARKPHPAFWLGGGGEKVTLKLVAKWADGCNIGGGDPNVIRQKIDVLRGHCQTVGRDIGEITISTNIQNIHLLGDGQDPAKLPAWAEGNANAELYGQYIQPMTADQLATKIEDCVAAGADYIIIYLAGLAYDQTPLQRFAQEIMPRFA